MAGETSAELTIVVRAQDAATRVLVTIGRTIGKVLTAPLGIVAKSVAGIFKQFFSLKSLLVGGGIVAAIRGLSDGLAKNADKYEAVFSADTQAKIDATASAFNKLGASLKQTFGTLVAEFDIAGKLNALSDWLRDNQAKIVEGFKEVSATVVTAAEKVTALFNAFVSGWAKFKAAVGPGLGGGPKEAAKPTPFVSEGRLRTAFGLPVDPMLDLPIDIGGSGPIGIPSSPAELSADWSQFGKNIADVRKQMADYEAQTKKADEIVRKVTEANVENADSYRHVADSVAVTTETIKENIAIIENYLTVGEAAEIVAGSITDGFEDMIRGTVSVGRAFGQMVATILGELGRLLIYRSLLNALVNIGASFFGGIGAGTTQSGSLAGSATSSGVPVAGFRGGFASGGTMTQGGIARVGENGPENVLLPRGAHVSPSQRSGMGGGDTINVYGARDARATAREVAAEMRRNRVLRRSLA